MKAMWNKGVSKKGERGVMMAMAGFAFLTFLLAAGMAVDISNFYTAGNELQNAADAAALAGASILNSSKDGITQSVQRATSVANSFDFNLATVNIPAGNVRFAVNLSQFDNGGLGMTQAEAEAAPTKVRFVRVQVAPTNVKVYLAGMVLGSNTTFTRQAVAGQSASGSTAPGTGGDPGLTSITNPSRIVLVEDPTAGGGTLSVVGSCPNNRVYTKGCTYNVTMTPPCDALSATYEIARGSYGTGHDNWSERVIGGLNGCYCKDSKVSVWTHPQAVNIRTGLDTLFNVYSGDLPLAAAAEFPPDSNVRQSSTDAPYTYNDYKNGVSALAPTASTNGIGAGVAGRRVLILGIMKKSSWWIDPNDPAYDTATMELHRYGAFFVTRRPTSSGQLQLEYISDRVTIPTANNCQACPATPGAIADSSDTTSGIAVPVLYR